MTPIINTNGIASIALASPAEVDVPDAAGRAMAGLVQRMAQWSQAVTTPESDINPVAFGQRRDIYGLREMAASLGQAVAASPAEEGRLLRAIEDVAQQTAIRVFGLAGAPDSVRFAEIQIAMEAASARVPGNAPADDVIGWFETIAATLADR